MTSKAAPAKAGGSNPPNQTLYVSNLPDKLQKADLKRNLYFLFTGYGAVIDIVALKTPKARGQAFIVYRDTNTAAQAMRSLQGFEFFGREMKIQYAKGKSDSIAKLDGTYKMPVFASEKDAEPAAERSELQQSIFSAPPGSAAAKESAKKAEAAKPADDAHGTKRPREDDEDDQPMDEDDDDEGADMEMDESD